MRFSTMLPKTFIATFLISLAGAADGDLAVSGSWPDHAPAGTVSVPLRLNINSLKAAGGPAWYVSVCYRRKRTVGLMNRVIGTFTSSRCRPCTTPTRRNLYHSSKLQVSHLLLDISISKLTWERHPRRSLHRMGKHGRGCTRQPTSRILPAWCKKTTLTKIMFFMC